MDNAKIARELVQVARELVGASYRNLYKQALEDAITYMENEPDLEPRSALKQAASDLGIPYGPDMKKFVLWAERKMN